MTNGEKLVSKLCEFWLHITVIQVCKQRLKGLKISVSYVLCLSTESPTPDQDDSRDILNVTESKKLPETSVDSGNEPFCVEGGYY